MHTLKERKQRRIYGDYEQNSALRKIQKSLEKTIKEIKKMAQSLEELRATITRIATAVTANTAAVEADVEQTAKVVEAVEALIKKIEESGTTDFTAEVEALSAATAEMEGTTSKLAADNAVVQAAIDKAVPPTPPVA